MTRPLVRGRLLAVAAALACLAGTPALLAARQGPGGTSPDSVDAATIAALDAANAAFSAAFVRGDGAALAAAYTDEAIAHPPAGGVLVGPEAIAPLWASTRAVPGAGHRLEPRLRRRLSADRVLELGRWHSRRAPADDATDGWSSGCYTVIWRRTDAGWRMEYDGWTTPKPESWACAPRTTARP